jgi:hypothetical protein
LAATAAAAALRVVTVVPFGFGLEIRPALLALFGRSAPPAPAVVHAGVPDCAWPVVPLVK